MQQAMQCSKADEMTLTGVVLTLGAVVEEVEEAAVADIFANWVVEEGAAADILVN